MANNLSECKTIPTSSASVADSQIKLATFNLFNYLEPPFAYYDFERIYSAEQWQKKQRWISDYLRDYQPDVIAFQEVFSSESLRQLVATVGYPYFAVVDQPEVIDDYIYRSPVVAIASRYPLTEISAVQPALELAVAIGLSDNFSFSRKVLRATVELPHIGLCDCYAVHFKSKRPLLEFAGDAKLSAEENIIGTLKAQLAGGWGSTIQRGSEAALLQIEMIDRREQVGRPMVLFGDFNNNLADGVLSHLLTDSLRFVDQQDCAQFLAKYLLKDAWDLYQATDNCAPGTSRKATHYYGASASVLDYILLSNEFDACAQNSLFEVSDYHTYDRHLLNPSFDRDGESTDHGIVSVTLSLRS